MDDAFLQVQMLERQQLCFAILNVVYESEYPITVDTIAHKLQQSVTSGFEAVLTHLVVTGHIRPQIVDGSLNYAKPLTFSQPRLPLPYYVFDAYPDDLHIRLF